MIIINTCKPVEKSNSSPKGPAPIQKKKKKKTKEKKGKKGGCS